PHLRRSTHASEFVPRACRARSVKVLLYQRGVAPARSVNSRGVGRGALRSYFDDERAALNAGGTACTEVAHAARDWPGVRVSSPSVVGCGRASTRKFEPGREWRCVRSHGQDSTRTGQKGGHCPGTTSPGCRSTRCAGG